MLDQLHSLKNYERVAVVTGGSKRVGAAVCRRLAALGFKVAIHFNTSRAEAEALATELKSHGQEAEIFQSDLARPGLHHTLISDVQQRMGAIGILINNASVFERDEWETVSTDSWNRHIDTNLRAPFALMQEFARGVAADRKGLVVNMLDQRVLSLTPHFVSYSLSKAALWALTQQMALALAPRIRVVGIGPGPTIPSERQTASQYERQCASVPLRQGSSPEEVAVAVEAILLLPSLTGNIITLDGGQHLQWASSHVDPQTIVE